MCSWEKFDSCLEEKGYAREVILYPKRFPEQHHAGARRAVVRWLYNHGLTEGEIAELMPYRRPYVVKILRNGSGTLQNRSGELFNGRTAQDSGNN